MGNYRNKLILSLAQECPECQCCGRSNRGDVVACHSNMIKHGKGTGIKAHDIPAYFCGDCHSALDETARGLTKAEKETMFLNGVYRSVLWLLESGHLEVVK